MPKSKVRKKTEYTINPANRVPVKVSVGPSSTWYVAAMSVIALIGLLWLLIFYIASDTWGNPGQPLHWMAALGSWNFLIGFSFIVVALLMTLRWR